MIIPRAAAVSHDDLLGRKSLDLGLPQLRNLFLVLNVPIKIMHHSSNRLRRLTPLDTRNISHLLKLTSIIRLRPLQPIGWKRRVLVLLGYGNLLFLPRSFKCHIFEYIPPFP
jgi:hypothetical protein